MPFDADGKQRLTPVDFDQQQRAVGFECGAGSGDMFCVFAAVGSVGIVEPVALMQDQRSAADRRGDLIEADRRKIAACLGHVAGFGTPAWPYAFGPIAM